MIATAATALRCQWMLDRRTRAQRAATLSLLSAATSFLVVAVTGPPPPSEVVLATVPYVAGAAAVTWSIQVAVPKLPLHAYLLLLLIVPGILDLSTSTAAPSLSLSEPPSENDGVLWTSLTPWVAVAMVAVGYRRGVSR